MKFMVRFLVCFLITGSLMAAAACNSSSREMNFGEPGMEVVVEEVSFEDTLRSSDILLTGKCIQVEPKTPAEGYTRYTFQVLDVLGGTFDGDEVWFCIPRAEIPGFGQIGTTEYEVGGRYLLPLVRSEILHEPIHKITVFGMSIDLERQNYRYYLGDVKLPENVSMESYAQSVFESVMHETEPELKEYDDDVEELIGKSDFIGRMRVVSATEGIDLTVAHCECTELYLGRMEDLRSFVEGGYYSIAVPNGSVKEGEEYIIGFSGSGAYEISVRNAVRPVSDELIRQIEDKKLVNSGVQ